MGGEDVDDGDARSGCGPPLPGGVLEVMDSGRYDGSLVKALPHSVKGALHCFPARLVWLELVLVP